MRLLDSRRDRGFQPLTDPGDPLRNMEDDPFFKDFAVRRKRMFKRFAGLFFGFLAVPAAVISWIVKLCGVPVPFF